VIDFALFLDMFPLFVVVAVLSAVMVDDDFHHGNRVVICCLIFMFFLNDLFMNAVYFNARGFDPVWAAFSLLLFVCYVGMAWPRLRGGDCE